MNLTLVYWEGGRGREGVSGHAVFPFFRFFAIFYLRKLLGGLHGNQKPLTDSRTGANRNPWKKSKWHCALGSSSVFFFFFRKFPRVSLNG